MSWNLYDPRSRSLFPRNTSPVVSQITVEESCVLEGGCPPLLSPRLQSPRFDSRVPFTLRLVSLQMSLGGPDRRDTMASVLSTGVSPPLLFPGLVSSGTGPSLTGLPRRPRRRHRSVSTRVDVRTFVVSVVP